MSDTTDQIIDDFSSLIMEHAEAIRDDLLPGAPRGRTARAITRYAQIIHAAELAIDTLTEPEPNVADDDPDDIEAMSGDFKYNHARARFNADRLAWDREFADRMLTDAKMASKRQYAAHRWGYDVPRLQQDTRDDGNGAQVTA